MRTLPLFPLALVALLAASPIVSAHPAYWSKGPAVQGSTVLVVNIVRAEDLGGPLFRLRLSDPVTDAEVLFVTFHGTDTFVDHVEGGVIEYHASSTEVDFVLDGYQGGTQVWAQGHFEAWTLVLTPNMGF